MTLTEQRHATRDLDRPVVGLIPADQEPLVRQMCGFIPLANYGPHRQPTIDGEIGCVEYVRYIVGDTDELRYISGEAAAELLK